MKIRFLGAAQTVTGSKYHLRSFNHQVLVDAGVFQGRKDLRMRNWDPLPLEPRDIDAAVLTHAHLDHTGYLPRLVREGMSCPVHCTAATRDLTGVLLLDAAGVQEEEAWFRNKHGTTKHAPALPLFDARDAEEAFKNLVPHRYGEEIELLPGWHLTFREAGHILGSSWLDLKIGGRRIIFSGDLGRPGSPIIRDPERPTGHCDVLIVESTYADATHPKGHDLGEVIGVIKEVSKRGGVVIVPAFAIERTQEIVYLLEELVREKEIPPLPIYVDSPMAVRATRLFHRYERYFDEEARELNEDGPGVLSYERLVLCESVQQSREIFDRPGPKIIVSASGMATGGRVLHHLRHYLPDPKNHVLLVGYQAAETRGARLEAGEDTLKIFQEEVPVRASVSRFAGLSGHADGQQLLEWAQGLEKPPGVTFLVHGEPTSIKAHEKKLRRLGWNVKAPQYLQDINLEAYLKSG